VNFASFLSDNDITGSRASQIFGERLDEMRRRTDRVFMWLLPAQWLFAIGLALVLSPYAWAGKQHSIHFHVQIALLFGALINSLPMALIVMRPGWWGTRHTVAVVQMLWSALLIHLSGGRIETHFHVFGSLAFLAFYLDWRVLASATVVVSADHFLRGLLWPESVYGTLNPEWWRFLEHAGWVVFEDVVLVLSCLRGVAWVRMLAERETGLEAARADIGRQVEERTAQLALSREHYRSLLESISAVPWEMDPDSGACSYIGPQVERQWGWPRASFEQAGFLAGCVHADDRPALSAAVFRAAHEADQVIEVRLCKPDGSLLHVRILLSHGHDANDRRDRVRGVGVDITRQKLLELELRQAQKLESVGRLAAGVAHEINTPVQFVSDSCHFLREGLSDLKALLHTYQSTLEQLAQGEVTPAAALASARQAERAADVTYLIENMPEAVERSFEGLQRVATIVRSMKEFAHPDRQEKVAADLNQAIQSTLIIAKNEYKYVADVHTEFGDLPQVSCFLGDLNQAVLNIVVNAAHAIGDAVKGTGQRGLITVRTTHDGDFVTIAIADTGTGIPDQIRDRIFDPFFTTKEVGKGTGQGLAIARSVVVDKHQGTLSVDTQPGRGTTFTIRLPIHFASSTERATEGLTA